jgi:hypothetical protein
MNLDEIVGEIIEGRGSGMVEQWHSAVAWFACAKLRYISVQSLRILYN